jgi:peptidyl-tRNA hydrolase
MALEMLCEQQASRAGTLSWDSDYEVWVEIKRKEPWSTPAADTTTAGEWEIRNTENGGHFICRRDGKVITEAVPFTVTSELALRVACDAHNASLAALREQVERLQTDKKALQEFFDCNPNHPWHKIQQLKAALKQKDEALLEAADHFRRLGFCNSAIVDALAIQPDSSALKADRKEGDAPCESRSENRIPSSAAPTSNPKVAAVIEAEAARLAEIVLSGWERHSRDATIEDALGAVAVSALTAAAQKAEPRSKYAVTPPEWFTAASASEAETAKLREALELQRDLWQLAEGQLNASDDAVHRVRFMDMHEPMKRIDAALAASAQAQDSPKAETPVACEQPSNRTEDV